MDLNLKGKKALVTGASSGLGAAAALALAQEGVEVTIVARGQDKLETTSHMIGEKTGLIPKIIIADVTIAEDIDRIVKNAGKIDIFVSNAGGPPPGQLTEIDRESWDEAYRLVLAFTINLTRGLIDSMIRQRWGRLVYITSVGVLQPIDDLILSNTYRASVTGFCKTVSNNYAKYGITANCVCPGYTATERLQSLAEKRAETTGKTPDDVIEEFASLCPAGRVGKPEELAALITFLAGDKAAYITGTSIPVDGGLVKSLV